MKIDFTNKKVKTVLFWVVLWLVQSILMSGGKFIGFYLVKNIAIVGLQALVVFINLKCLFPIFFEKKKFVLYILSSVLLIYIVFSFSFFFIDIALSFTSIVLENSGIQFSTNFWVVLSGSSFYSLALVCSTIYRLLKINNQKEKTNLELINNKNNTGKNSISIKEGNKTHLLNLNDIFYIKGLKEYVVWHTRTKKIITLESLNGIEKRFREQGLVRIHKSYIVNFKNIDSIQTSSLNINNETIPIGRTYKEAIKNVKPN